MIIQFSEAELDHLTIQPVARCERSGAYLEEREQVWNAQMESVLARGGQMWNGEVYTLESILPAGEEQVTLRMSTCEYKDIVFWHCKGPAGIANQYGEDFRLPFTGVICVPITRDGKFVFGIRADRPEQGTNLIGSIGGTLNKDEMEVDSFADIRRFMLREIQEETLLDFPLECLRFFGLNGASNNYQFWFTARLPLHSDELQQMHRPGEFSSLVALTQQEARETTAPVSGAVRRLRPYLHWLPRMLED